MRPLLIIPALLLAATRAAAQLPEAPGIEVGAVGEVEVVPDQATLNFAVETQAATSQAAAAANTAAMERVIAALVAAGVPRADIETRNFSVYPDYTSDERGNNPRIVGYRVTNSVSLTTTRLPAVGGLIDTALGAGANRVNGITFGLQNPQAAEQAALREAVTRARASAETMAQALGVQLGAVRRATTSSGSARPVAFRLEALEAAAAPGMARADVPIQPGEQIVQASVTLVFDIR